MKLIFNSTFIRNGRFIVTLLLGMILQKSTAQVSAGMTAGVTTEVSGSIGVEINGDWLNQGNLIPGNFHILLNGTDDQFVSQDFGSFFSITIDKPVNEVWLNGDISVKEDTLWLVKGDFNLNSFYIVLDATATLAETQGNTVKGVLGDISTTRVINIPNQMNVGGLGLVISSIDDLGMTEIRRGHAPQSANAGEGILRYFDVFPQNLAVSPASLTFLYDESELNGNIEAALKMYGSLDSGHSWVGIQGTLDTTNNSFSAVVTDTFNRFTLSSNSLIGLTEISEIQWQQPCQILFESSPNPFYTETELRFKLSGNAYVEFTVFDMAGRRVAELAKGEYNTEWHNMVFDGSGLAEGIYFFHLQTHCGSVTRSVVLSR